jgi:MFS family permease
MNPASKRLWNEPRQNSKNKGLFLAREKFLSKISGFEGIDGAGLFDCISAGRKLTYAQIKRGNTMTNNQNRRFFHPTSNLYRYTILVIISFLTFGSYFAYDSIGAIAPMLKDQLGFSQEDIGLLYSWYSYPNLIMVLIGGIIIDRIGTRRSSLLFSSLIVIGAVGVALTKDLNTMILSRAIFGIGSESLIVAQSAMLARWFKGKELAFAFGFALFLSRLGTLFTFNIESAIANAFNGFEAALWAAVIFSVVSLLGNFIYVIMDKRAEKPLQLAEEEAGDRISFGQITRLPLSFWFVALLCVTFYSAIFPFTAHSTTLIHEKWAIPLEATSAGSGIIRSVYEQFANMFSTAGGLTSVPIFASMLLAPWLGKLVDKIGKRGTLMMVGSLALIPAHLVIGYTDFYPALPMAVIGLSFALVPAAMWPSVPLIVEKNMVGTAFGLMTMIQNIGLATMPQIIGAQRDATGGWETSMSILALLGVFGLVFAFLLKWADTRSGGKLENP